MPKNNASSKDSRLYEALSSHFSGKINAARIKFICKFMIALCKVQTVNFQKLGSAFESSAKPSSCVRGIQRFMANYVLNGDLIAKFIFSMLPEKTNLRLTLDRTNWKFGESNINILMLGIVCQGVAFPLMFAMLDKRGNSSTDERIDLIERFVQLFGVGCIESLVADREFIGEKWLSYLNKLNIRYFIRIRNNFKVYLPKESKEVTAWHLFNNLKINKFRHCQEILYVNNELCYLSGKKIKAKDGSTEFLIIVSYNDPERSMEYYQERWQIETCFKAMKSSGFDLEKTHLTSLKRLKNLVLLVMMTFTWCYKVGIHLNEKEAPIKIKKHGRRAISVFKYGLNFLASLFLNPIKYSKTIRKMNIFQFLSCT